MTPPILTETALAAPQYIAAGWEIVSDGPTGVQIRGPRVMRRLDKAALIIGAVLIFAYGIGLILVGAALIDYYCLTPRASKFLPR